jgi:rubredoxin
LPAVIPRQQAFFALKFKAVNEDPKMKTWQCLVCGFIYEEEKGWPEEGIPPGTRWEDVPADWSCPECGATKGQFEMIEL